MTERNKLTNTKPDAREVTIGFLGNRFWWAYPNGFSGDILRAKNGVGRNFRSKKAALAAARAAIAKATGAE